MRKLLVALACLAATVLSPQLASAGGAQFLMDARTGQVMFSESGDDLNHPASLTKMMTLYLTFEALHRGKISWNSSVPFSKHASSRPPTKLRVKAGDSITVREAVLGMIVQSANDAATAMAEKLGGTEPQFAQMMTAKARQLGMARTTFVNASGLPDDRQITTARDMSTLGIALMRDYPKEYALFATKNFAFRGRTIHGHNNLMYRYKGMDGIKTGYTNASGFNLVSSVERGNARVVGVIMGGRTAASRDKLMERLVNAYIGRASGGSQLVAATHSAGSRLAKLGDDVPVPTTRRSAVAAVNAMSASTVPVPGGRYDTAYAEDGAEVELVTNSISSSSDDIAPMPANPVLPSAPSSASKSILRQINKTAAKTQAVSTQNVVVASEPAPVDGWQIQVAASDDRDALVRLLGEVQDKFSGPLRGMKPYTPAVTSGGSTLYRARFVGFNSKKSAWDACEALKKHKQACLAFPAQG
ncbi:D-alanyl-D-alanine carboxypeptidase [Rhizobium halophytocola]|uniref:D-alanyl-D-alanine carboxypeptidase (Penicillin-binding protein 5/6) n=1 Tax=Rhizobium halophytocola TaxID=735519 RepID=A0ABS4DX90_9HYPH|nr:D-alanyl-D-alanine carboxypeptidase [Rhizobium halophytocola]MBP1850318.1 D-alanyl-D-alanine carboxypeptidase (penicillin-binding protein 5/6) [Rhizobium halophytocola]